MHKSTLATALALSLASTSVSATIVSGEVTGGTTSGTFVQLFPAPGFTVGNNLFQSEDLMAFDELQAINLPAPIGGLPGGTLVDSHFIIFDTGPQRTLVGNIVFDSDILAILRISTEVNNTHATFANPNVTYNLTDGLEGDDVLSINGNRLDIISMRSGSPGDFFRVLTVGVRPNGSVPEPASWAMMIFGFGAVGAALRRRKPKVTFGYS